MSLLLPYQAQWVADRSPVKVCVKSRQIGITWSTAYEAVEVASAANGQDFWYQTISADDAGEFIKDAAMWADVVDSVCERDDYELSDDEAREWYILPEGERSIKVTSIRFKSGKRVSSIAHSPRKLRGKGGVLCLDEAAYHDNLEAILKAGHAFRVWGGRLIFISTQDTIENPFNQLVERIESKTADPRVYSLHKITIHDAVDQGLYRRICEKSRRPWRLAEEEAFVAELLASDGADSEFLCLPMRSGGQYISTALVHMCRATRPVVRWRCDDAFLHASDAAKSAAVKEFFEGQIKPLIKRLNYLAPHYMGTDFGRVSDLSAWAVGETNSAGLDTMFMIELGNVPYDQQRELFFMVAKAIPRLSFVALDGAGNGAPLGEAAVVHFGEAVAESVKTNDQWYGAALPVLRSRLEDNRMTIPDDLDVQKDLAMFELINGVPKLPKRKTRAVRQGAQRELRHADSAIALAMLSYAAEHSPHEAKYDKVEKRGGLFAREGAY